MSTMHILNRLSYNMCCVILIVSLGKLTSPLKAQLLLMRHPRLEWFHSKVVEMRAGSLDSTTVPGILNGTGSITCSMLVEKTKSVSCKHCQPNSRLCDTASSVSGTLITHSNLL